MPLLYLRGSGQRLSAGGDALGHRIVDAAADLRSRNAVQLVGGNDVQHVEIHVRVAAEHIFQDGRGVGQNADHDGNARLLRDLERAVAEAVQLAGLARVALREYGDRGLVLLQELDGLEDGAQRRPQMFRTFGNAICSRFRRITARREKFVWRDFRTDSGITIIRLA